MHILLTNDDGIFAPGLRALAKAIVAAGHRATVFAPDSQRSAVGHAITIYDPIRVERVEFCGMEAYAVNAMPADCARLGLYILRNDPPDCVLSGVNRGANRGAAILSSGTVAAAMEASLCGVPGIAVSRSGKMEDGFGPAAELGARLAAWAVKHPLPRGEIYSLNVPHGAEPLGVRAATHCYDYIFEPTYQREDGGWRMVVGPNILPETEANSELSLNRAGYASLSILSWNIHADTPLADIDELNQDEENCHGNGN